MAAFVRNKLMMMMMISVTPVFSRITERLVMRKHLLPVIPNENLRDQYAYKLSGSTTSALVSLTDTDCWK